MMPDLGFVIFTASLLTFFGWMYHTSRSMDVAIDVMRDALSLMQEGRVEEAKARRAYANRICQWCRVWPLKGWRMPRA